MTAQMSTRRIVDYLDDLLGTREVPDYPNALNGLQLENEGDVRRIAAAVDISSAVIDGVIDVGANMLIVHHGMFWSGTQPLTGSAFRRTKRLIENDVAVYSSHLPLDRHPLYGNNALLATELGLEPSGEFARFRNIYVGVSGEADVDTEDLFGRAAVFSQQHGGSAHGVGVERGRRTRTWAICTGAGASSDTLREASERGIDTLIVGEGPHHTAVEAAELDIAVIYAGHYATETLGVQSLAAHVSTGSASRGHSSKPLRALIAQ